MTDWHDVSVFPRAQIASRTVPLALPETMCNASREQMRLSQSRGVQVKTGVGTVEDNQNSEPVLAE